MRTTLTIFLLLAGCGDSGRNNGGGGTLDFALPDQSFVPLDIANSGSCQAGHYVGKFDGTITVKEIVTLPPFPVKGSVDLTLDQTGGEFYAIMNGQLMGMADNKYPYTADLVGTLDCGALKLENASIQNGTVTVKSLTYHFAGPVSADYDTASSSFVNGMWMITDTGGSGSTGMGTWQAAHTNM